MSDDRIRENRLRAAAKRQGLELRKSRRRDPRASDFGAYWLIVPETNSLAAGCGQDGLDLDGVEKVLGVPKPKAKVKARAVAKTKVKAKRGR